MKQLQNVIDCYNKTAEAYAASFYQELTHKPFDRLMLRRFAEENRHRGKVADLGCGPGHTTRFLYDHALQDIIGIDLSPGMVEVARQLNPPQLQFEIGNMLQLNKAEESFRGIVAFYAIVHFSEEELAQAMVEVY